MEIDYIPLHPFFSYTRAHGWYANATNLGSYDITGQTIHTRDTSGTVVEYRLEEVLYDSSGALYGWLYSPVKGRYPDILTIFNV